MSFAELGLSDAIVRAVAESGYTSPTPIQKQAIPAVLKGGDLLAGAQTGTGKTAGFTLPILQRLSTAAAKPGPRAKSVRTLILTPTRELAAQVEESVRVYGKYLKLRSGVIFGGVGINPQIKLLSGGLDILVATPGRLLDHMEQRTIDLSRLEILVLDEADRMLDMGFIRDIKRVLAALPPERQNLLFSATFSDEIKALADSLLDSPQTIEVAKRNSTVEVISQKIHPVDRDRKHPLLAHLVKTNDWSQVLVFTRTKHGANKLVEQLERDGISAMAIHGNKSQSARTKALADFKSGDLRVLVATDIAARGIDIDQLPHVVNYDLPNVPEDYVHRIGRTGRAGATGEAVSLVCVDEHQMLKGIEKLIRQTIAQEVIPGFEPDPHAKAQPIQLRSGQGRHASRPAGNGRAANGGGQRNNDGDAQRRANGEGQRSAGANGQRSPSGDGPRGGNANGQRNNGSSGGPHNGNASGSRNSAGSGARKTNGSMQSDASQRHGNAPAPRNSGNGAARGASNGGTYNANTNAARPDTRGAYGSRDGSRNTSSAALLGGRGPAKSGREQ